MAYRITRNGIVIEADSVEDVQALLAVIEKPLLAIAEAPVKPRIVPKPNPKPPRGASDGGLEGRILAVLEHGPTAPGDLCEAVKAERYSVNKALAGLEDRGQVRSEGATTNRRWMLAKPARAAKEAV